MQKVSKPWGLYIVNAVGSNCCSKTLFLLPNKRLSLQSHNNRDEKWLVIEGKGVIQLGVSIVPAYPGTIVDIPAGLKHRVSSDTHMIIAEWWIGDSSEDDIIRYEDDYGRIQN